MMGDLKGVFRAAHYLLIRSTEPLEKTAAMIVSEIHGLKRLDTVREIAKKHRRTASLLVASMSAQEIAELSKLHAPPAPEANRRQALAVPLNPPGVSRDLLLLTRNHSAL